MTSIDLQRGTFDPGTPRQRPGNFPVEPVNGVMVAQTNTTDQLAIAHGRHVWKGTLLAGSAMQISGVQMSSASPTQMPSQKTSQQNGSTAQTAASHSAFSQPVVA